MTVLAAPDPTSVRVRRMMAPAAVAGGLGLATLALHVRDPHVQGSWGVCPSADWFGLWCPGCGGLRAVNDLSNGDVLAASSSNLVLVALVPFIVLGIAVWSLDRWRGTERTFGPGVLRAAGVGLGVTVLVFTVLRNLAIGSWLAP